MMRLVLALALTGAASAEVITIKVSGGSFDFPYYEFDGVAHKPELEYGKTYEFVDDNVSPSHPFLVGPGNGAKLGLPQTITVGDDGVEYVCQIHSNMASSFDINPASTPTPTPTPAPTPPHSQFHSHAGIGGPRWDTREQGEPSITAGSD